MEMLRTFTSSRVRMMIVLVLLPFWNLWNFSVVVAFAPVVPTTVTTTEVTRRMTSTTTLLHLGGYLDADPMIVGTATTTIIAAIAAKSAAVVKATTTATSIATPSSGSAATQFFFGSAVFVGLVATLKWNDSNSTDQIREYWEKWTAKPTPLDEYFVAGTTTPIVSTPEPEASIQKGTLSSSTNRMPNAKSAVNPQELSEMMKDVTDSMSTTTKKKKRFVVKLLQKIVMPWRKWDNL
jgi:hypothetical protein